MSLILCHKCVRFKTTASFPKSRNVSVPIGRATAAGNTEEGPKVIANTASGHSPSMRKRRIMKWRMNEFAVIEILFNRQLQTRKRLHDSGSKYIMEHPPPIRNVCETLRKRATSRTLGGGQSVLIIQKSDS
ncbi:hypothetical protein CDAR_369321 [Caerostris darwini]|uniref:Uncharacterized protein n=1 Tax=Caerostris darwini TaxID=1538125 RepID=A0AAV4RW84_9ARAC|nr:hypothetical protein CDAR_369321 [Caerostris darwini]